MTTPSITSLMYQPVNTRKKILYSNQFITTEGPLMVIRRSKPHTWPADRKTKDRLRYKAGRDQEAHLTHQVAYLTREKEWWNEYYLQHPDERPEEEAQEEEAQEEEQ